MARRDYCFPGTPYPTQTALMDALYSAMETSSIGLFESPTGTGKTLAVICAVTTFLKDQRQPKAVQSTDWVDAHSERQKNFQMTEALRKRAVKRRQRLANLQKAQNRQNKPTARRLRSPSRFRRRAEKQDVEDRFVVSDTRQDSGDGSDVDVPQFASGGEGSGSECEVEPSGRTQTDIPLLRIVFATRTHTQLTQFVSEFRKTSLGSKATEHESEIPSVQLSHLDSSQLLLERLPLSLVLFGSRKHMCINETVRKLESASAITERCRELNENVSKTKQSATGSKRVTAKRLRSSGCPFRDKELERVLRDRSIMNMHSVEELAEIGTKLGACPYYASRAALETNDVDVIGVPYSAVLHGPTRDALGLTIDSNTVVVFDEAHNIVDSVCDMSSCCMSRRALVVTATVLERYTDRYLKRLAPSNLFSLRQLVSVARSLLKLLPERPQDQVQARVCSPSALLFETGIDNINMYGLVSFMKASKVTNKLRGFIDFSSDGKDDERDDKKGAKQEPASEGLSVGEARGSDHGVKWQLAAISSFESFVRALADCADYGRVAIYPRGYANDVRAPGTKEAGEAAFLKYFALEPGSLFASAVQDARAVLLLGGTLSPRAAIKDRLLGELKGRTVTEFECEHVVPAENVKTIICGTGPNRALEFTHKSRQSVDTTDDLGRAILCLARRCVGGVVIFFSSYGYLSEALKRWRANGTLAAIDSHKKVFQEERGDVGLFTSYQNAVIELGGAMLCAVMGGKLSEGINFSDELGRMVIIVGMPFANATNVEMAEVLKGLDSARTRSEYLQNACLTVVNQSIGRVVRHAKDYAAIVLLDRRYSRPRIQEKLPAFVKRCIRDVRCLAEAEAEIQNFFAQR